jgi:predicted alpha/beta-hydrolase family hydrolase
MIAAMTRAIDAPGPPPPIRVVLAHGASGSAASMRPHVEGLRARGVDAHAIDLPKRRAEDAVPAYRAAIAALPPAPAEAATRLVIGGHSYGGRVASLLAADADANGPPLPLAGLLCFSYPLHRPGAPGLGLRTDHWPRIAVPTLILEGESDPFARLDLLRAAMPLLRSGRLVTFARQGHGLLPVLDAALDVVVAWLHDLTQAGG